MQDYGRVAHEVFDELESQEKPNAWQIIFCCLQASPDLDYERMRDLAVVPFKGKGKREVDKTDYNSPRLALIAATCRAGAYEEAITILVRGDLRETPLGQLFQAMARKQLGNEEQAVELLKSAKAEIAKNVPTVDGPRFEADYLPDRWSVYVEQHTLLREVQDLVDPDNTLAHIVEDSEGGRGE